MPDELAVRYRKLGCAIDDLLSSHHGIRAHLKSGHPPFVAITEDGLVPMPLWVALDFFGGPGPLLDVWTECRAVEWLRYIWTYQTSRDAPAAVPVPVSPIKPVPAGLAAPSETETARTPTVSEAPP